MDLIDDIVSGDEILNVKPHSEPFLLGTSKVKASTSTTISKGDNLLNQKSAEEVLIRFLFLIT